MQCVWQRHSSSKHESKQTSLERSYVFECSRCFGFGIVYAETRWVLIFRNIRKPNKQKNIEKTKKTKNNRKTKSRSLGDGGVKQESPNIFFFDVFFCFCFYFCLFCFFFRCFCDFSKGSSPKTSMFFFFEKMVFPILIWFSLFDFSV